MSGGSSPSSLSRRDWRRQPPSRQGSIVSSSSASCSESLDELREEGVDDAEDDDNGVFVNQKCGDKIKALQSILIKQSLPFANPSLLIGSRTSSVDKMDDKKGGEPAGASRNEREAAAATTLPKPMRKPQCLDKTLGSGTTAPSHYATISRLEAQDSKS